MRTTLTIRAALRKRAVIQGKSVSEAAREILCEALEDRPLSARVGHLKGKLELPEDPDPWQKELREGNWRF